MSLRDLTFFLEKWETNSAEITHMRKLVFMDEYNLPLNFLRHRDDTERYHVVAYDDMTGTPVGTGCIHKDGHIGRIAILQGWREDIEVPRFMVSYLLSIAKSLKIDRVWLNAPVETLDFYSKRKFHPVGEPYEYCGLHMQKIELWLEAEQKNQLH